MSFLDLTQQRFSARAYTTEPVTATELDYILECARMAPSAVNFQPWHFYVIQSPEARTLVQQCYDREWFRSAPVYIVCAVKTQEQWVRKLDNRPYGDVDIAIAAEHICLAAADQGLGSCWVCNFDAAMCAAHLNLPADERPMVIVALGHTDAPVAPKKRKEIDQIVTRL